MMNNMMEHDETQESVEKHPEPTDDKTWESTDVLIV